MGVKYNIHSQVVDISTDTPFEQDVFFVDTNIWFWMTYTKANALSYQLDFYPTYLYKVLNLNASVYYTGLSLAELAHIIEKTEREIFLKNQQTAITTKEFRHDFSIERNTIISELKTAWNLVKSMGCPMTVSIDDDTTDSALKKFENVKVDGYDLFLLEAMKKHGITNIITDDGDFATVPGIQVFTANKAVLDAARKQKKIIKR